MPLPTRSTRTFATYQTSVTAAIAARGQVAAAAMTTLATDVDGAAASLMGQLRGAASARAIVDALVAYRASVASAAHVTVLTTAGLDAPGAQAALETMADLEVATR